jgi:hypothetical protein
MFCNNLTGIEVMEVAFFLCGPMAETICKFIPVDYEMNNIGSIAEADPIGSMIVGAEFGLELLEEVFRFRS